MLEVFGACSVGEGITVDAERRQIASAHERRDGQRVGDEGDPESDADLAGWEPRGATKSEEPTRTGEDDEKPGDRAQREPCGSRSVAQGRDESQSQQRSIES